jgi:hypothetical protein
MAYFKNFEIKTHTDSDFGVFQIELEKVEITEADQEINLMIDNSGSMDDMCGDGTTKMHQIKHVTKNILRFVAKNCIKGNVKISLKTFNVDVETIFDKTVVTEDILDELIPKIDKVYPNNGTDIGVALKSMHSSGINRHNIFMSDGDANVGITEPAELAEHVDPNAINTFVGFGLEHNPKIFATLSETKNSAYYFVDKVEKSGNAYGEILDGILYNCLKDVYIRIVGGTLYDWKTNEWKTEIFVGNMSGEAKKTFHIMSSKKEDMQIMMCGTNLLGEPVELTVCGSTSKSEDLQKIIYRQKTLEILFKAKCVNLKMNRDEIIELKKEMKEIVAEMKAYMKESNDALIKNLCDDIVITYRTLGTQFGHMYSCSRQTSQGEERLYNVSDTPRFKPSRAWHSQNVFEEEEELLNNNISLDDFMDSHDVSEETPYYLGRVATVMRSVTGEGEEEEDEEF